VHLTSTEHHSRTFPTITLDQSPRAPDACRPHHQRWQGPTVLGFKSIVHVGLHEWVPLQTCSSCTCSSCRTLIFFSLLLSLLIYSDGIHSYFTFCIYLCLAERPVSSQPGWWSTPFLLVTIVTILCGLTAKQQCPFKSPSLQRKGKKKNTDSVNTTGMNY